MKVKELLSKKSKWTKGTMARDKKGFEVDYNDPTAYSFCLVGAIRRCYGVPSSGKVLHQITDKLNISTIHKWNDRPDCTFEEVKALVEELDI